MYGIKGLVKPRDYCPPVPCRSRSLENSPFLPWLIGLLMIYGLPLVLKPLPITNDRPSIHLMTSLMFFVHVDICICVYNDSCTILEVFRLRNSRQLPCVAPGRWAATCCHQMNRIKPDGGGDGAGDNMVMMIWWWCGDGMNHLMEKSYHGKYTWLFSY